jgi:hypothetical protein
MQYGSPTQPGLKGIQDKEFKDFPVIVQWNAPLFMVVLNHEGVGGGPLAIGIEHHILVTGDG